ncbi:lamin tail domain-containing protein, partial [Candidatus Woesearchaeota archaeon]|nr:lamin tail domain-containing protein [Candidatus Woesearchaeota archaeon]
MKGKPISCILAIVLILSICSAYALASSSDVIINEFLSHPHQQSENEWIEIYNNNGTSAVDLTGWTINDTLTPPKVIVTIADNTIIQPNSHLIFYTVKELNDGEDTIKLIDETGTVIDEYTYNSDIGINNSLGRLHDGLGQWEIFTEPTPNATNNRLPSGIIADQEINEDTLSNFTITSYITDPDEDIMVFSVVEKDTLKVDCKINDTNLTLNPAADWNGTASCKVEADDGYGKINRTFNIIVSNVNDQPYFDPVLEDKVIDEDLNFTYDINASDIDEGDSLTFESNITALGGSINDSGVLEWTPDNSHVGNNTIEVIVCDDSGAENNCISSSFTIEVENVNDAPVISQAIASLSFLEGRSVSVNLNDYVDDIDNTDEDITWAASGMSGLNVFIDPEKMMEVSASETTWHGTERFNLTADDGALIENNDTEEITVDVQSILSFSDLVVTIDGNDYSAGNNDLVGPASPDSSLSISLKLKNNYPKVEEWVEEIVISARLDSSIGDNEEITTSPPVNLDGSKSISRQLTFQNLPLDIVEGEYELTIRASGNDYDG